MELLRLSIRRLRFNIVLITWLIFYAGKQAVALIHNVAAT